MKLRQIMTMCVLVVGAASFGVVRADDHGRHHKYYKNHHHHKYHAPARKVVVHEHYDRRRGDGPLGEIVGGLVGGAVGYRLGQGDPASTAVGVAAGAIIGHEIED